MSISHTFEYDIHIFDTDCYGLAWHGSYVKWLEMGRVDLFKSMGFDMDTFTKTHELWFPVAEQNMRFKRPARFGDRLSVTTTLKLLAPKMVFETVLTNTKTQQEVMEARTDVVLMTTEGKMLRRFPESLLAVFNH